MPRTAGNLVEECGDSTLTIAQHDDRCQPWIEQSIALLEAAVTTTNNPAPRIWLAHARGIAAHESGDIRQALDNHGRVVELSRAVEHHAMEAMAALFIAGALTAIEVIDPIAYSEAIEITHRHRVCCELTIGYLATHLLRRGDRRAGAILHGHVNASGSGSRRQSHGRVWATIPTLPRGRGPALP